MPNWGYLLAACLVLEGIFIFVEAQQKVIDVHKTHGELVEWYSNNQIDDDSFRRFYGDSEFIQEEIAMALRHKRFYQGGAACSWEFSSGKILALTIRVVGNMGIVAIALQLFTLPWLVPRRPVILMAVILWGVLPAGLAGGWRTYCRKIYGAYAKSFESSLWSKRNSTLNPAERALYLFSNFAAKSAQRNSGVSGLSPN